MTTTDTTECRHQRRRCSRSNCDRYFAYHRVDPIVDEGLDVFHTRTDSVTQPSHVNGFGLLNELESPLTEKRLQATATSGLLGWDATQVISHRCGQRAADIVGHGGAGGGSGGTSGAAATPNLGEGVVVVNVGAVAEA